ncbi:MAG: F-box protein [Parachlamydia sp.]|jgi:hypothetical protein|nr:F-box protein [Parachlamydia sp.]
MVFFTALPNEIYSLILKKLEFKEVQKFRLINSQFYNIVQEKFCKSFQSKDGGSLLTELFPYDVNPTEADKGFYNRKIRHVIRNLWEGLLTSENKPFSYLLNSLKTDGLLEPITLSNDKVGIKKDDKIYPIVLKLFFNKKISAVINLETLSSGLAFDQSLLSKSTEHPKVDDDQFLEDYKNNLAKDSKILSFAFEGSLGAVGTEAGDISIFFLPKNSSGPLKHKTYSFTHGSINGLKWGRDYHLLATTQKGRCLSLTPFQVSFK